MSVLCTTCGKQSQDPEFCDHCNADLGKTGQSLPPERCPLASDGAPLTLEQRHVLLSPESSIVVRGEECLWRVHWIAAHDWLDRRRQLERRLALQIPALPGGRLIDDPAGRWLAFETRESTPPWSEPRREDPLQELQRLSPWLHSVVHALESLHQNSFLWLNFDPNALEDTGPPDPLSAPSATSDRRSLRITNLDLELFPFQSMPERVRVHPHFAAPEVVRFRADDIGPRTDVFHLAMFAYYWLAGQLPDGLPGGGLESCDYTIPAVRLFSPQLPEGIHQVLIRGLAMNPRHRFATPRAFAHAIDEAIINVYRRRAHPGPVRWEIGGHTRTGRSKTELQRGNEDTILIKEDAQAALALVADGVSTCDIGSGGLASTMASIVVENALVDGCSHESFPGIISSATRRGSEGLLEWAIAHHCQADLEAGKDLMGTTLTVGWLREREISIANLGDSRAYLVTADAIEQLTVDGDLANDLLARGAAPEEVKELGMMARALRECIGGCTRNEAGELTILPESCTPRLSRWPLVPGDIFVLCTDGLVEEGFFLEPATLAQLVRQNKELSAADLALLLVEAADAMQ
ncbi:MAG: protein phosphatase 2C domain-containing protein, partial [Planctomycetes bacterium]|nr:protein phosphatase 2C domain-containing protein [Planctomycetota bacterium]